MWENRINKFSLWNKRFENIFFFLSFFSWLDHEHLYLLQHLTASIQSHRSAFQHKNQHEKKVVVYFIMGSVTYSNHVEHEAYLCDLTHEIMFRVVLRSMKWKKYYESVQALHHQSIFVPILVRSSALVQVEKSSVKKWNNLRNLWKKLLSCSQV